jgi:hypothetical protein
MVGFETSYPGLDWNTLPLAMVGFETPYPGLDWNTLSLAMVGFETPYPVAMVELVLKSPMQAIWQMNSQARNTYNHTTLHNSPGGGGG